MQSHGNLRKFIEILFKFAPHPDVVVGDTTIQVISAVPRMDDSDKAKRIRELEDQLKERDEELHGFRASVDVQDVKEIEHAPIRSKELPEHSDPKIKAAKDEEISPSGWKEFEDLSDEKLEKRLRKLPEKEMLALYKKLEREVGLRIDPENYKRPVIIRNFMLLWTRKKKDEREKAARGEELVPMTDEEKDRVWSKDGSRRGLAGKVTRLS